MEQIVAALGATQADMIAIGGLVTVLAVSVWGAKYIIRKFFGDSGPEVRNLDDFERKYGFKD